MPLVPLIDGWETVAEMEAALGIPEGNLVATLDRYNDLAARGEDPDFHKQPEFLAPQDKGPWGRSTCHWARRCMRGSRSAGWPPPWTVRCCAKTARVVPGLYAAGACAANIAQDGKGYASGTQLGEGSFFGRRAGAHAAREPVSVEPVKTQRRSATRQQARARTARPTPALFSPDPAATGHRRAVPAAARGTARRRLDG